MTKKISQLPSAGALIGPELVEIVQSGTNKKTTTQDVANLGGGGLVLLASAVIAQAPHVDIDLPLGYLSYKLVLNGFRTVETGEDSFNYRFSFDDGDTFASGMDYYDRSVWISPGNVVTPHIAAAQTSGELANGYPGQNTPGNSLCGEFNIFPGSASLFPQIYFLNTTIVNDADDQVIIPGGSTYKVVGRATTIRLSTSFGANQDIEAGGSYALFGTPNP